MTWTSSAPPSKRTRDDGVHVAYEVLLSARIQLTVLIGERARIILAAEPLHVVHHEDAKQPIAVGRGVHEPVARRSGRVAGSGLLAASPEENEENGGSFHRGSLLLS
ncbi:MAG TPA: hypothetical protein VLK65_17880 [Vicinamibacteria bacterium]|nr:hypothetical protein [Vicinamibacteria bacterium]